MFSGGFNEEESDFATKFFNKTFFEREILGAKDMDDLGKFVRVIFESILIDPRYSKRLNFTQMKSYDHLSLSKVPDALMERLISTARSAASRYYLIEDRQLNEALQAEKTQNFLRLLAHEYTRLFEEDLLKMVADTFIEALCANPREMSIVLIEALNGTRTRASILSQSGVMAASADQVRIRFSQAKKERVQQIEQAQTAIDKESRFLAGMKKNSIAIKEAQTSAFAKGLTADRLREIVINEDNKESDNKRMLQYLPADDLLLNLQDRANAAALYAMGEKAIAEYKATVQYLKRLYANNTKENLELKEHKMGEEIPKLEKWLKEHKESYEELESRRIEEFDSGLAKIYEVIIANIGGASR